MTIPTDYIHKIARIESSNNPHAQAATSSACGLFQFTNSTWAAIRAQAPELKLTDDGRMDADQSTRAFCWLAEADGKLFHNYTGRDPEPYERYLMHFLGGPRGAKVCMAQDARLLADVFGSPAYEAVSGANKFLTGWTAGQLKAWSEKKLA